jgi:hypothetical protein
MGVSKLINKWFQALFPDSVFFKCQSQDIEYGFNKARFGTPIDFETPIQQNQFVKRGLNLNRNIIW